MRLLRIFLYIFFFFLNSFVSGQEINNTSSFRNVESNSYFRFNYENDFFSGSDYYYTQGINLEVVNFAFKKLFVTKVLLKPRKSELKYGISVEHDAYTPTSIRHHEILYGDHPFCATLSFKFFSIAVDSSKQQRISSSLTVGVIGSTAYGEWIQKSIHKALHDIEPLGWENQIHNDIILNYEAGFEKEIFSINDFALFSGNACARAGTLNDDANAGFVLMIGKFSSPFQPSSSVKGKWQFHFYDQPLINAIAYDAVLQGGMFNHSSPYTISSGDMQRITFQNNFGVVMTIRKIYLEYSQAFLTKEFTEGNSHRWGGVRVGISF